MYLLHWNAGERGATTVRSLLASEGIDIDIVAVDNASVPAAREALVAALPSGARVLQNKVNVGYSGAANAALGDYLAGPSRASPLVVVAAHDVLVDRRALAAIAAAAEANPHHGILGPAHWTAALDRPSSIGGRLTGRGALLVPATESPAAGQTEGVVDVEWLSGALMCLRLECVRDVGGFDDDLFAYWEDVDICLRARDAGWRVGVVLEARAAERGYSADFFTQPYFIARNHLLVARKRRGRRGQAVAAARVLGQAVRAAIGSLRPGRDRARRRTSRSFARGRWAGLRDGLAGRGGPPPSPR